MVQGLKVLKKVFSSQRSKRTNSLEIKVWLATTQPNPIKKNMVKMKELDKCNSFSSDSEIELRQNPSFQKDKAKAYTSPVSIYIGETRNLDEAQSMDLLSVLTIPKSLVHLHPRYERKCSIFKEGTRDNL